MTNPKKLDEAIARSGLKKQYIAENILHIDYSAFWRKATNVSEFTASEIKALKKALSINDKELSEIFFAA